MITLKGISHIYNSKDVKCKALTDVNIEIPTNKFIVISGQSGSGKTTLMNIIGSLMKPSSGEVMFDEKNIYEMNGKELSAFRRDNIGFIFQNFFLENAFTSLENIYIPLFLNEKLNESERKQRAVELLTLMGLEEKQYNLPTQLSGGECQRVAIARALANNPQYLIADEPTGNLDSKNGEKIISILRQQIEHGRTVILVTHNKSYIQKNDVVFEISDGKVIRKD